MKEEVTLLRENISTQFGSLKADITDLKSALIKWMFIFWISQLGITFGLLVTYIKK